MLTYQYIELVSANLVHMLTLALASVHIFATEEFKVDVIASYSISDNCVDNSSYCLLK